MKNPLTLLLAIGLASCVPKAITVAEAPEKPKISPVASAPGPSAPTDPNDGLRLPEDMLALPNDAQLRSAPDPSGDGDATIITRPPAE